MTDGIKYDEEKKAWVDSFGNQLTVRFAGIEAYWVFKTTSGLEQSFGAIERGIKLEIFVEGSFVIAEKTKIEQFKNLIEGAFNLSSGRNKPLSIIWDSQIG